MCIMASFRAQGATQSCSGTTYCPLLAQGATEYLVLLAVVLIVALVSVALLGFFPGMASDAQITQSQAYWQGASPIAIVEASARVDDGNALTYPYIRIRNTGVYPIRVTGLIGGQGHDMRSVNMAFGGDCITSPMETMNMSDYFYLAPGEENYFSYNVAFSGTCRRLIRMSTGTTSSFNLGGASSVCQNSSSSPGTLSYKSLGFEYIEYIDGQQITKRQIGKEFIVKCLPPVS